MSAELPRMLAIDPLINADDGKVRWAPAKSAWITAHCLIAAIGGIYTFSLTAFVIFLVSTAVTLCLGHSLGMHRRLIHNSYDCPRWLEYLFVHLGVLVGLAGPIGMVRSHDLRDWAQRQPSCHPYLRHGTSALKDAWWQLHCDLILDHPPLFKPEDRISGDKWLILMERTWMLQQLPLAILLFAMGAYPWLIWGISVRVAVSVIGHWLIGYLAHNHGEMDNEVLGAAVQGHNVKLACYLTMGESWHNNHHAYPGSAALGLYENQPDPGWAVLQLLSSLGLAWNIVLPQDLAIRNNLKALTKRAAKADMSTAARKCKILQYLRLA